MENKILLLVLAITFFFCTNKTKLKFPEWELVADNQKFPEGITWDYNGNIYSSNCYGGWITKISNGVIDTFLVASDSTFSKTNGMVALKDGSLIACDYGLETILKISKDKKVTKICEGFEGKKFNRPNDLTVDSEGNIFFTDPKSYGKEKEKLDGRVFHLNLKTNKVKLVADSLAFPNGISISPKDKKLYVCESAKSQISVFEISNGNKLINKKVFIELPGGDPDGINFDIEGNLYAAHFGSGTLFVISSKGKILRKIKTPGKKPSNLEFCDENRKILYLTEDETNSIYKIRISISGFSYK